MIEFQNYPILILYLTVYKMHPNFSRANQEKILVKQSTNIKRDEINIMNIIDDNTLNRHNSLLDKDNRYTKITLRLKLTRVAR